MPRRKRFPYREYVRGLLEASRTTVRVPKQREVRAPRTTIRRQKGGTDPVLIRQLITAEKRAEVAEDEAILGHRFKLAEQESAHKFKLQEIIFKSAQDVRTEAIKMELGAEETTADIRSKQALTKLRQAQTDEVVSKPVASEWKAMIDTLQENQKQQGRVQLKVLEHKQAIGLEEFKQTNAERLAILKESIKPPKLPKETVFEELERLKNTGAVSTVGDVAKFWFGKGKKREDVETLSKMEMRAAGIDFEAVFEEEGGFIESAKDKQRAWQKLFTAPLARPEVDQETSNLMRQFPSRVAAERFLINQVRQLRRAGEGEETLKSDELEWLQRIEHQFPQQPSVYHQLIAEPDIRAQPSMGEVFGRMKQDLKGLFSRASSGLKMSAQDESELTKQLQDFFERSKQFGLPEGRQQLQKLPALGE